METESAEPRVAQHQEHVEPAGRVHRVVVPRLHLRAQSVALEQPAGRPRRHAAPFGGGGAGRRPGLAADAGVRTEALGAAFFVATNQNKEKRTRINTLLKK